MSTQVATGYCRCCGQRRRLTRPGTNHLLHLFLTICTLGAWIFIWSLASIKIGGWRCNDCGARCSRNLFG